jgi:hypothetical protein
VRWRAGTTADPLNQAAMPNNSAMERSARTRQRRECNGFVIDRIYRIFRMYMIKSCKS